MGKITCRKKFYALSVRRRTGIIKNYVNVVKSVSEYHRGCQTAHSIVQGTVSKVTGCRFKEDVNVMIDGKAMTEDKVTFDEYLREYKEGARTSG